jgi:hypothetical protein
MNADVLFRQAPLVITLSKCKVEFGLEFNSWACGLSSLLLERIEGEAVNFLVVFLGEWCEWVLEDEQGRESYVESYP